jgi:hypothetical protein
MLTSNQFKMIADRKEIKLKESQGEKVDINKKKYIDFTLRKYIKNQLRSLKHIFAALDVLPDKQITALMQKDATDQDIYDLLGLAIDMMKARNFRRLCGDPENPASWETIAPDIWEHPGSGPGLVQASDIDIARSAELAPLMRSLMTLVNVGSDPVFVLTSVQVAQTDPTMQKVLEKHPEIIKKYEASEDRISKVVEAYRLSSQAKK